MGVVNSSSHATPSPSRLPGHTSNSQKDGTQSTVPADDSITSFDQVGARAGSVVINCTVSFLQGLPQSTPTIPVERQHGDEVSAGLTNRFAA